MLPRSPSCRWILPLLLAACAAALIGCELGQGSTPDAAETTASGNPSDAAVEEPEEETVTPEPVEITGCDWVSGAWTLADCEGAAIAITINLVAGCQFQITSKSPVLAGGFGTVKDGALTMVLPATGSTCNGTWDGTLLKGACGLPGGPCGFAAERAR